MKKWVIRIVAVVLALLFILTISKGLRSVIKAGTPSTSPSSNVTAGNVPSLTGMPGIRNDA